MEGITLVSTPDLTPGDENVNPSSPDKSPPRVARRRLEQRRARFSVDGSESTPTIEERKKYRQTLVDIHDDAVFHQVLQDLARLEKQDDDEREKLSRDDAVDEREEVREEWKPDKGEIRAWFVTRELVQGERRHGRLLARGVAVSYHWRVIGYQLIYRLYKQQQRVEGMKSHLFPYLVLQTGHILRSTSPNSLVGLRSYIVVRVVLALPPQCPTPTPTPPPPPRLRQPIYRLYQSTSLPDYDLVRSHLKLHHHQLPHLLSSSSNVFRVYWLYH